MDISILKTLSFVFSHITKTTTWEDPRKTLAAQSVGGSAQQSAEALLTQTVAATPQIAAVTTGKYNHRRRFSRLLDIDLLKLSPIYHVTISRRLKPATGPRFS